MLHITPPPAAGQYAAHHPPPVAGLGAAHQPPPAADHLPATQPPAIPCYLSHGDGQVIDAYNYCVYISV